MKYEVRFFAGDYPARQDAANRWGADVYVCHHFNALANDNQDTQDDNATLAIVGSNASQKSVQLAATYCKLVSDRFGTRNRGVVARKRGERGDVCLRYTAMPAFLTEPLFVSDITHANIATSAEGQKALAECLVTAIKNHWPTGAKVAFSVGHMGKSSQPYDKGAAVVGHPGSSEADLSQAVLLLAERMLKIDEHEETTTEVPQYRDIEIVLDGERYYGRFKRKD